MVVLECMFQREGQSFEHQKRAEQQQVFGINDSIVTWAQLVEFC